jgi:hypothetical protein
MERGGCSPIIHHDPRPHSVSSSYPALLLRVNLRQPSIDSTPVAGPGLRDHSFGLAFTAQRNFALEERGLARRSSGEGRMGSRAMRS